MPSIARACDIDYRREWRDDGEIRYFARVPFSLKQWREQMAFTPSEACEELEVQPSLYSEWENGDARIPRHIQLACHALALGM
jgi:predicted transcriptional regulator